MTDHLRRPPPSGLTVRTGLPVWPWTLGEAIAVRHRELDRLKRAGIDPAGGAMICLWPRYWPAGTDR